MYEKNPWYEVVLSSVTFTILDKPLKRLWTFFGHPWKYDLIIKVHRRIKWKDDVLLLSLIYWPIQHLDPRSITVLFVFYIFIQCNILFEFSLPHVDCDKCLSSMHPWFAVSLFTQRVSWESTVFWLLSSVVELEY